MLVQDGPDPLPRPPEGRPGGMGGRESLGRPEDFDDLETAVARISRFVLRVQALADRMEAAGGQDGAADRGRRVDRLLTTVDVAQRTIQATVWQHADRRRRQGERRASPRRQAADRRHAGRAGQPTQLPAQGRVSRPE